MAMQILLVGFFEKLWLWLDKWDTILFLKINAIWTNGFFDTIFPLWREASLWLPLYVFVLLFVFVNYKWKAVPWLLFFIATVALADQVSSGFLKNAIGRIRPCNEPLLQGYVRVLVSYRPQSGSFTSSHATNHFAMAMFIWMTLKPVLGKWGKLFFFWAASISYAQVYVGVHYPLDIIGGCLLGCLIGGATASFFNRRIGLPHHEFSIGSSA